MRKASIESQQVGGEFADFLKSLGRPEAALDVSKDLRKFIEKLSVRIYFVPNVSRILPSVFLHSLPSSLACRLLVISQLRSCPNQ